MLQTNINIFIYYISFCDWIEKKLFFFRYGDFFHLKIKYVWYQFILKYCNDIVWHYDIVDYTNDISNEKNNYDYFRDYNFSYIIENVSQLSTNIHLKRIFGHITTEHVNFDIESHFNYNNPYCYIIDKLNYLNCQVPWLERYYYKKFDELVYHLFDWSWKFDNIYFQHRDYELSYIANGIFKFEYLFTSDFFDCFLNYMTTKPIVPYNELWDNCLLIDHEYDILPWIEYNELTELKKEYLDQYYKAFDFYFSKYFEYYDYSFFDKVLLKCNLVIILYAIILLIIFLYLFNIKLSNLLNKIYLKIIDPILFFIKYTINYFFKNNYYYNFFFKIKEDWEQFFVYHYSIKLDQDEKLDPLEKYKKTKKRNKKIIVFLILSFLFLICFFIFYFYFFIFSFNHNLWK